MAELASHSGIRFDNSLAVGKSLQYLNSPLRLFIEHILRKEYGETWTPYVDSEGRLLQSLDTRGLLGSIIHNRKLVETELKDATGNSLLNFINSVHMIIRARNLWAHQREIVDNDALIILDTSGRMLQTISVYLVENRVVTDDKPLVDRVNIIQSLYNQIIIKIAQGVNLSNSSDHAYTMRPAEYSTTSNPTLAHCEETDSMEF